MLPIPSRQESVAALFGAWRLFLRDTTGLQYLDPSLAATSRSFFAAVLCLPVYILLLTLHPAETGPTPPPFLQDILAQSISYLLQWVAFPVVLVTILDWMGKPHRWPMLVTALNWSAVVQLHLSACANLLAWSGVLPETASMALVWATLGLLLAYKVFVVRIILGVSGWGGFGLVMLDLLMGVFIIRAASSVAGAGI